MDKATRLLKKRQMEMQMEYGIYRTDWAEDWPNYYQITFARNLFRERIKNKYQIFLLFYPMIGIVLSAIIAILFGIIAKTWAAIWLFVLLAVLVIIAYSAYFAILSHRIKKLNGIIGHYYSKYGREVLKNLYKRYRPDELPPEPDRYYDLENDWFNERDFKEEAVKVPRRKKSKDQEEEKHESEQVVMDKNQNDELEPTDDLAAEARAFRRRKEEDLQKEGGSDHVEDEPAAAASGIDLHLVGDDGKINSDSSAPVVIDNNGSSGSSEEDQKSDSPGEPGETLSAQTEERREPGANEVEAVKVIDAEPIRKESDAEDNQQAEGEDNTSQEEERQNEFPSVIDGEEVSSDSETVIEDPFAEIDYDDYEEDDDYAEGNDDTEGSFEDESLDDESEEESEEEESEDETEDDESEDDEPEEPEEPEDESDEEESGEELDEEEPVDEEDGDGPLFPEGYLPTVDELLAALQTLSNS